MQQQPLPPVPTGIDYLHQIAAPPPTSRFDKKTKLILLVCAVLGVLSIVMIIATTLLQRPTTSPQQLSARLTNLQTIAKKYHPKLHSADLEAATSSLLATLTTAQNNLNDVMTKSGIDIKKQAKTIAALESADTLDKVLDDAFLNVALDRVYGREMAFWLEDTIVMLQQLERSSSSTAIKGFAAEQLPNLRTVHKQFTEAHRSSA